MRNKYTDAAKGDAAMTDFQFKTYIELRDKYDEAVRELELLRKKSETYKEKETKNVNEGVSDYQFQRYEKLRDKCEELSHELALLREENARLKVQAEMLKSLSSEKKGIKKKL